MSFCAASKPAIRATTWPSSVIFSILLAAFALLLPSSIDDASAQGFRLQGPRGGFGQPSMSRAMSQKSGAFLNKSGQRFRGNLASGPSHSKGGGMGMGGRGGMGGRHPSGTADIPGTHNPKGRWPHPRWPRRPPIVVPGDIVVAVPGGPPPGPPSNGSGGQPPSNPPPSQSGRGAGAPPPVLGRRYVPNEVVVEVASNVSAGAMTALARRHRLTQLEAINLQTSGTSIRRLRINDRRSVPAVVRALAAEGAVMAVQPNYIATLQEAATRVSFPADLEPYAAERLRMPEAHSLATGERVRIAVIDSGADTQHPELAGIVLESFDAIGTGDRVHPHGTAIVGMIAARARLRGTAPAAHFLIARAFGTRRNSNDGTSVNIIKALDWAIQRGARVINMSFAGDRDPAIERRLAVASSRGIILVAAAGNAGANSPPLYPAAHPSVIAVTATDDQDRIFRGANRGTHVAVAAPGVDLWVLALGGDYRLTSGTSFSSAEISGVVALMLERNPGLTPDAVRRALTSTARDLGPQGPDATFGAGLVDAYQAVLSVVPAAPAAAAATTAGAAN